MFFRIVTVCLVLAAGYALYEIWAVRNFYNSIYEPRAEFTIHKAEGNQSSLTIVEFLNYGCLPCKTSHLVLLDYVEKNPSVTLVVRPVPFSPDMTMIAAQNALAAGLQGKFWEMDKALTEFGGTYDEKFYRETAAVYDIDYERMIKDANDKEVFALAKNNVEALESVNIQTTPALMVGKTLYQPDGALTLPDLIRMVQTEQGR